QSYFQQLSTSPAQSIFHTPHRPPLRPPPSPYTTLFPSPPPSCSLAWPRTRPASPESCEDARTNSRGRIKLFRIRQPRWRCSTRRNRKSTRLNSSHLVISYAVFCLKKKKKKKNIFRVCNS